MAKKKKISVKKEQPVRNKFQPITPKTKVGEVVNYCEYVYALKVANGKLEKAQKKKLYNELTELDKKIGKVFGELNLKCFRCDSSIVETFEEAANLHPFDLEKVIAELNEKLSLDMSVFKDAK